MDKQGQSPNRAVDSFARECVIKAFSNCLFEMHRDIGQYFDDPKSSNLNSVFVGKTEKERMEILGALAAERMLAGLFANVDLNPHFEIKVEGEEGDWYDLADAYEIPLICAFDEDGWIAVLSNYPSYMNIVEHPNRDQSE